MFKCFVALRTCLLPYIPQVWHSDEENPSAVFIVCCTMTLRHSEAFALMRPQIFFLQYLCGMFFFKSALIHMACCVAYCIHCIQKYTPDFLLSNSMQGKGLFIVDK